MPVAEEGAVLVPVGERQRMRAPQRGLLQRQRRPLAEIVGDQRAQPGALQHLEELEHHARRLDGPHSRALAHELARLSLDLVAVGTLETDVPGRCRHVRGGIVAGRLPRPATRCLPVAPLESPVDACDEPVDVVALEIRPGTKAQP